MDRRNFIKLSLGTVASGMLLSCQDTSALDDLEAGEMPTRSLGRTGHEVSLFSLGGEATIEQEHRQEEAVEIINRALDLGVNYIDTAPSYGNGGSESNIGQVMRERREEVFLATKTHDRSYAGTMELFEQSLERLQTDYLDLYQLHNIRVDRDLDRALSSNGAIEAMEELKSQGLIKNIGITGHRDPQVLLRGIEEYDFDCILMALNAGDIHYRPFQEQLLEKAVAREMGIIAMKVVAAGRIIRSEGITSMEQALGYSLSFPVSTAIVGISNLRELEENVQIAKEFSKYPEQQLAEIEELTASYEREANFFKYYW
ncbi:aldo/keto reductase [Fuchsiella alkaliacetigena]|uniref:aldo/keto reductase n=1 Tax=Fuchsiella alkaliacetigena TaxID=957042 RepID=UPI00200A766D|nr:aldo/keto reductase [Fuchsiella alkaliacetigena]MCK8824871.1 aldo/keto reductase [Fuchsiella alkaliacetigena]